MKEYKPYNFNLIKTGKSKSYPNEKYVKAAAWKYANRNDYVYIKKSKLEDDAKGIFFAWDINDDKTKITFSIIKRY